MAPTASKMSYVNQPSAFPLNAQLGKKAVGQFDPFCFGYHIFLLLSESALRASPAIPFLVANPHAMRRRPSFSYLRRIVPVILSLPPLWNIKVIDFLHQIQRRHLQIVLLLFRLSFVLLLRGKPI